MTVASCTPQSINGGEQDALGEALYAVAIVLTIGCELPSCGVCLKFGPRTRLRTHERTSLYDFQRDQCVAYRRRFSRSLYDKSLSFLRIFRKAC